ncbi:hypothetical protein BT69DRAFT_1060998 [Atractiella rhizophila]|nr:hypothetical protein BT69DRAFT_1060998 [Atractiella rhizophila]
MSSSLTCATFSANPPSKIQLAPCCDQPEGYSQALCMIHLLDNLKPFYTPGVRLVANDANSTAANSTSNSTLPIAQSLVQTLSSNSHPTQIRPGLLFHHLSLLWMLILLITRLLLQIPLLLNISQTLRPRLLVSNSTLSLRTSPSLSRHLLPVLPIRTQWL